MRPYKTIRRIWARASFATVIPLAAFILGLVFAALFTVFYFTQSHASYLAQTASYNRQLARVVATDIAADDLVGLNQLLSNLAPGRAIVIDAEGQRLAGSLPAVERKDAVTYPVLKDGLQIAALVACPTVPYQPPMHYAVAVMVCFAIAIFAAMVMQSLAKLASRYIEQVTSIVNNFSLKTSKNYRQVDFNFAEFRKLNVATIRTTRRLVREISALQDSAQYDTRTGLLNERSLHKRIEATLESAQFDNPAALIVIELNDYGRISEKIGSTYSDQTGKEIAKILKTLVRTNEARLRLPTGSWKLASLHSGQFAILIQNFGMRDDLAAFVRELQLSFRVPLKVGEQSFSVSLSGSIVLIPEDGDSVALIRQRADATILDLKRQDKKGFSFYSPKLERQRDALVRLEIELQKAVKNDCFVPLFQPKIDLATGRICGAEALARWRLENGRLVSPSVFIELAEETGMINAIGEQIMHKACMETVQWNQLGHRLNIAVNVSPKQFERDGLARMILDALAKSGLSPRQLEIEITESLAIQHPDRVRSVLKPLRKLGIKLAVDDFGTGHSNLATLTQLDFDVFKIDRQFVAGTPHDTQANAIVEMILGMASTLEMQIVGEGIETEPQAEFLKQKGCHIGQGFLYSPPVTAEAFRKMLDEQPFIPARLIA